MSRISAIPATKAISAPSAAASSSDSKLEIECSAMKGNSSGSRVGLISEEIVITPAAKAPIATKAICPNEITPELPMKT